MLRKKGLSSVVATISIVLLTIIAVVLVASYVIPLVRDSLAEGTECFDYQDYFYFEEEFGYNCHNGSLYVVSVGVKGVNRELEKEVDGLKLAFLGNGESKTVDVTNGMSKPSSGEIRMLESSVDPLEIPGSGEVKTYVYDSGISPKSAKVFVLLKSGRVCDESDSIKVDYICEETTER